MCVFWVSVVGGDATFQTCLQERGQFSRAAGPWRRRSGIAREGFVEEQGIRVQTRAGLV